VNPNADSLELLALYIKILKFQHQIFKLGASFKRSDAIYDGSIYVILRDKFEACYNNIPWLLPDGINYINYKFLVTDIVFIARITENSFNFMFLLMLFSVVRKHRAHKCVKPDVSPCGYMEM
jgi:hypothetical protein